MLAGEVEPHWTDPSQRPPVSAEPPPPPRELIRLDSSTIGVRTILPAARPAQTNITLEEGCDEPMPEDDFELVPSADEPIEESLEDEVAPFTYSISSYGADYPVDALVRRIQDGSISIPQFQRGFVWKPKQASRFVESLLLGLPVPGIFLSKEQGSRALMVIDGQQRLRTLQYFYNGSFPDDRPFELTGVQRRFEGLMYNSLPIEGRRQLDDSILHATIVKQDEPSEDESSIYYIFERLNTGGTLLQPQEIRACIYHGAFNDRLGELNLYPQWRQIYGKISDRMRDQELILRFLALYFQADSYQRPMKGFLNRFMARNRTLQRYSHEQVTAVFCNAIGSIADFIGPSAFRPKRALNAAIFDAVMVGVSRRLSSNPIRSGEQFRSQYDSLMANDEFTAAVTTGTSGEEVVRARMELATAAFTLVE